MLSQEACCQIRPLEEPDLAQVVAVHNQSFPIAYDRDFFKSLLRHDRLCLVAAAKDRVLGVITASVMAKTGEAYIMTLCVVPQHRRQGMAFSLLQALMGQIKAARHAVVQRILLHVLRQNEEAKSLYLKAGFSTNRIDRGHYLIDNCYFDAVLMQMDVKWM